MRKSLDLKKKKKKVLKLGLKCTTFNYKKLQTHFVRITLTNMHLKFFPSFFLDTVTPVIIWCQTTAKHVTKNNLFRLERGISFSFAYV